MKWAKVRDLYLKAVGESSSASSEALIHLNEGHREVANSLNIEELEGEFNLAFVQGEDSKALPSNLFAIHFVANTTTGQDLQPEPGGMRGRERFLAVNSDKPAESEPTYYARSQGKLFIRGAADDSYTLRVRGKLNPDEITDASWGLEPTVPQQYHMTVAKAAAKSFLSLHPKESMELDEGKTFSLLRAEVFESLNGKPPLAKEIERFDQRGRFYHRGFRMRAP